MSLTSKAYQKRIWWLLGVTMISKIVLSFFLELGNDEVYYFTYALQPDWNHFDHPPMVGWLIQLSTFNLNWISDLSMRLGAIFCSTAATFVVFKTGALLKNERAGFLSAMMYSLSIYTSIIAGLFILPDSPQMLFFTLSIYYMIRWVQEQDQFKVIDWILLGLLIGFSTLSKVHGLYLWAGMGAFIIFHQIKSLKEKNLYIAAGITLICILPIFFWNFQNDFITYQFHSKRVAHDGVSVDHFFQQVLGEFIYQNPFVYIASFVALIHINKIKKLVNHEKSVQLLLWLSLPLIFTFWVIALFNPTLPHWTGPGFISLFLIAGVYWSQWNKPMIPLLLKAALGLFIALIVGFLLLVYQFPKQLGSTQIANLGEYNPINDVTGWTQFSSAFSDIVMLDSVQSEMSPNAPILIHKWFPAGHILFYTARPLGKNVIAVGNLVDVHKFAWLNKAGSSLKIGEDAYCIVPSNLPADPHQLYGQFFEKIAIADTVPIRTKNVLLRNFYVYRLKNCKKIPPVILP